MTRILFVCHGNICRSPMAEFVMKDLVGNAGLSEQFHIESAATSTEEIGNEVYPPARRMLASHGISCKGKTARQLRTADYGRFDLLVGMDRANIRNMTRICGGDPEGKIRPLLDGREVADPWYTGDFQQTWDDVSEGCTALLHELRASSDHEPRSIYGRIVAEADRFIEPEKIIERTVQYGLEHYPELDRQGHWQRTLEHMKEKYSDGGYLRLWFPESPNVQRLEALRSIIRDETRLKEYFERIYEKMIILN